jgi:hypothetical protein
MRDTTALSAGVGVAAFGAGAAVMFLLDPRAGGARRALLRDKAVHARHALRTGAGVVVRDLENRARGVVAELRPHHAPIDDEILRDRVRAHLGRVCSHPHAIEVHVRNGIVELLGRVLAAEVDGVVDEVRAMDGVRDVDDDLEVHDYADIQALQGGSPRGRKRRRGNLPPATRFLVGLGGVALSALGIARRGPLGLSLAALGGAVVSRAIIGRRRMGRRLRAEAVGIPVLEGSSQRAAIAPT